MELVITLIKVNTRKRGMLTDLACDLKSRFIKVHFAVMHSVVSWLKLLSLSVGVSGDEYRSSIPLSASVL